MEGTSGKRNPRRQRRNTEVQQETQLDDMTNMSKEVEPSCPLQRPPPQENTRCMLKDTESRLTLCGSNGKVNLVTHVETLALILSQLQEDKKWSHERELKVKEI